MIPDSTVRVVGPEAEQTMKLLEALEDHDDVQSVASNADFDQDELERLSA
jgi:transcriptional/translational regulatory protein YebC/TACO1